MTQLLTLTTEAGGLTIELARLEPPDAVVIGRSSDCDVTLTLLPGSATVSRRHCLVELQPDGARLYDLGSRNGTLLNGRPIGKRSTSDPPSDFAPTDQGQLLEDGDRIVIGDVTIGVTLIESGVVDEAMGEACHVA